MNYQQLIKKVKELCAAEEVKTVVVGELENVDGPLNLNPAAPTAVTWGGWQSSDNAVVAVTGTNATVLVEACAVHVEASVTFINADGPTGATGNAQRAHPELWVLKNGVRWARADTYLRDANGQDADTAGISKYDPFPSVGDVYSLEVQRDSTETAASGQAVGTLEVFRDPEIASYLQVAAYR